MNGTVRGRGGWGYLTNSYRGGFYNQSTFLSPKSVNFSLRNQSQRPIWQICGKTGNLALDHVSSYQLQLPKPSSF